jgi:hypothetical protein
VRDLIIILFLFPAYLYGQETIDTIPHIISDCLEWDQEQYNFSFSNDTINFFGKIEAICAAEHFLICSRLSDTIFLTKFDIGGDDCVCLYNFDISLTNCDKNEYRLVLLYYAGHGILLDTLISRMNVSYENKIIDDPIVFPNPTSGMINIHFPKLEKNIQVKIFNLCGQSLFSKIYYNSENIIISNAVIPMGIYLMRIDTDNSIYNCQVVIK